MHAPSRLCRWLLPLLLLAILLPVMAEDAPPEILMPGHADVAVLPVMTLAMDADVSKATWDLMADLLTSKGYEVVGYADTLRAMADVEATPVRLGGLPGATAPAAIYWWRSSQAEPENPVMVKALCEKLGVSRVITMLPTAVDAKPAPAGAAAAPSAGMTNLITREAKNIAITLSAAAWGAQTGRCVWEASIVASPPGKRSAVMTTIYTELRPKTARTTEQLPPLLVNGLCDLFGEFFQRDRVIYESVGTLLPVRKVLVELAKNRRGRVEGVKLSWEPIKDPRVKGYVVYRAEGDNLFSPYPSVIVTEPTFLDKNIDEKNSPGYRYLVAVLTTEGIEGAAAPVVTVSPNE